MNTLLAAFAALPGLAVAHPAPAAGLAAVCLALLGGLCYLVVRNP